MIEKYPIEITIAASTIVKIARPLASFYFKNFKYSFRKILKKFKLMFLSFFIPIS